MKIQLTFIFLIMLVSFPACDTTSDQAADVTETYIKMIYPEKVVTGQTIYIVGSNFKDVTEIVLPDNITIKDFERTGFNQLSVVAPSGLKNGFVILRAGGKEYKSPNEIKAVTPTFSVVFPTAVKTGEEVTIKGENLLEVQQVIFPDDIVVDALHFKRKSDTEIIVVVPPGTINGDGVLKIVTLSGTILTTTIISIEVIETPGETSKVDPITPNTIILLDYEEHGGHNGNWDNGWGGNTEIAKDAETGNTFLRVTGNLNNNWVMNCNHQGNITATWPWSVADAENYIIKFDVLIPSDVDGTGVKGMQFIFGDKWDYWFGDNLVPKTTDGEWVTIRVPFTKWNKQGFLDFKSGTNGLFGTVPKGVCFDNLRIDPM
ncbi:MAG: IPT/TIG domain protein [Bacteroidetes bacterium ADurb.BinA174]|nr:MAG: IPT/TIG domain protein [Bacteroidetes bacterium ADurb.BinA174]